MRYALVSDLHANRQAWRAVDQDIRNHGADAILCLGDIVGYGPDPVAVLDAIRDRADGFVLGDHDAIVAGFMDHDVFDDDSRKLIDWTMEQLDDESAAFLTTMPYKIGDDNMLCVHAEAEHPDRFNFIFDLPDAAANFQAMRQNVAFIGHTHVAGVFMRDPAERVTCHPPASMTLKKDHKYIVSVGAVGDPLDGVPRSSYVIYDTETRELTFRRVGFDFDGYRAAIIRSGTRIEPQCLNIVNADMAEEAAKQGRKDMRPSTHTTGTGILKRIPRETLPPVPARTVKASAQEPSKEMLEAAELKKARIATPPKKAAVSKAEPKKSAPTPSAKSSRGSAKLKRRSRSAQPAHSPEQEVPLPGHPPAEPEKASKLPWIIVIVLAVLLTAAIVIIVALT